MTVSYENTNDDAVAWTHAYLTRTQPGRSARKRMRIFSIILLGLLSMFEYTLLCSLFGTEASPFWMLLFTLLGGIAAYLLTLRPKSQKMAQKLMRNGHFDQLLGPKRVTVAPEGLHTVWSGGEVLRNWSSLKRMEEDDKHIYLFYSEVEFGVLPKRAFCNEMEQKTFLALVERYRTGGMLSSPLAVPSLATPVASVRPSTSTAPSSTSLPTTTTTHAPGTPWWRNRSSVDTESPQVQRRSG